jgi:hypothetical protein
MSHRQIKLIKEQEDIVLDLQRQLGFAQGCKNPRHQVAQAIKLFMVMPNICGSSVWDLLHVTFLHLEY